MQNRTYGDLFNLIQSLAGVNSFTTEESADISRFINRRFFTAFNKTNIWARYVVPSEQRKLAVIKVEGADSESYDGYYIKNGESSNAVNSTYADADVFVKSDNKSYVLFKNSSNLWSLGINDTGFTYTPITGITTFTTAIPDSAYRQDSTDVDDYDKPSGVKLWKGTGLAGSTSKINLIVTDVSTLLYESLDFPIFDNSLAIGNTNIINDFIRIHRNQSFLNDSSLEYDFFVDFNGANVLNVKNTDDFHVTYKKKFVKFTTSSDFGTSTEEVPEEFFQYIAHSAYADFLRMDGQTQKALVEEQNAEEALNLQLERSDIIFNINTLKKRFSTYINNQSR